MSVEVIDIMYFIEHPSRELDVACWLKHYLEKKHGLRVEVRHFYRDDFREIVSQYLPKVVVTPYCYGEVDAGFRYYLPIWKDSTYFNMSWEELYYNAFKTFKKPRDEFAKTKVIHHAWGEFFRDYLLNSGVSSQNIFVNGNPSYTLYEPNYSAIYEQKEVLAEKHSLDRNKKWVFFPENYGWGFYDGAKLDEMIRKGIDPYEARLMRHFCFDSLRIILEWFDEVCRQENIEVIIKPRPATPLKKFNEFVESVLPTYPDNLHILKEDSVREWIISSDLILSSYSTSLIEAAVAGKPAFMVKPIELPRLLQADWHQHAPQIRLKGEFIETIQSESKVNSSFATWAREEMMSSGDAILNLADYLQLLVHESSVSVPKFISGELLEVPHGEIRNFEQGEDYISGEEINKRTNQLITSEQLEPVL